MTTGTHQGRPPATAVAPNDTPTIPSATQMSATSRSNGVSGSRSLVRHLKRMFNIMNTKGVVRQIEQWEHGANQMAETDTAAEVVALIAASLRRERARAGVSLTGVARRAG